jgi:hypothetical protein
MPYWLHGYWQPQIRATEKLFKNQNLTIEAWAHAFFLIN